MKIGLVGLDKLLANTPRLCDDGAVGKRKGLLPSARASDEGKEDDDEGVGGASVTNPHLVLQQWMMFPIASPVQRKLDATTANPPPPALATSSSSMSIGSSGESVSSRDSRGSAWTDKRSDSISPPALQDDEEDRKPRAFSNLGYDRYREYEDDSPFDSEASYETDTDYEGEGSDSDSDEEGSSENLCSSSSSMSVSSHSSDDDSVVEGLASKKPVNFDPPLGPPPGKKVEKSGSKMAPPKGPPPKKEARSKNSLLHAARKRMSDPRSVHGNGVRKFL